MNKNAELKILIYIYIDIVVLVIAVAMRTCNWPNTKPPEETDVLFISMQYNLHVHSGVKTSCVWQSEKLAVMIEIKWKLNGRADELKLIENTEYNYLQFAGISANKKVVLLQECCILSTPPLFHLDSWNDPRGADDWFFFATQLWRPRLIVVWLF